MNSPTIESQIFLYEGRGASPFFVEQTENSLKNYLGESSYRIIKVDNSYIERSLGKDTQALIIGGGNAFQMSLGLSKIFQKIRHFVFNQGNFIGFCAGAYLASSNISYKYNRRPQRAECSFGLNIFNGTCKGPAEEKSLYTNPWDTKIMPPRSVSLSSSNVGCPESPYSIYWQGGGYFISDTLTNEQIVAKYTYIKRTPAAIIHVSHGMDRQKGNIILSGPHPEMELNENVERKIREITNREEGIGIISDLKQKAAPSSLIQDIYQRAGIFATSSARD